MIRKFLIVFAILLAIFTMESIAQQNFRFGVICGSSFSRWIIPEQYSQTDKWKIGIYPKAICRLPLKKGFWFQTEVGLTDYGIKIEWDDDSTHQILKESRYFIQFTELIGYALKIDKEKRLKLNVEAGPFFGYYLISNQHDWAEDLTDHTIWKDKYFRNVCEDPMINKYLAGVSAGIGISKDLNRGSILLDFRYDLSLTRITKYLDDPRFPDLYKNHYQLISFSIGYLFGQNKW